MTPLLRAVLLLLLLSLAAVVSAKKVRLAVDPWSQPESPAHSPTSLANMSLTPWTFRESYRASRVPSRIFQAQCLTTGCLSLQGGGEDGALEARPIHYQVLVLDRVKKNKRKQKSGYKFRLRTEMITVGCTCVRPSVVPQQ